METTKQNPSIAILGGGAVALSMACDCLLGGLGDVRVYDGAPFFEKTLVPVGRKGITMVGPQENEPQFFREGTATPGLVTSDMGAAMAGADIVVLAVPALAHSVLLPALVPHLEDGMVIHIVPDNFGSLRLRALMRAQGCTKKIVVGGWNCAPMGARMLLNALENPTVRIVNRFVKLKAAAFPLCDQAEFLQSVAHIPAFDCARLSGGLTGGDTILDVDLSNLNPVLHIPTTVLGVAALENFGVIFGEHKRDFSIFSHAACPSIAKVQAAFYQEEEAIAKRLGITMYHFEREDFFARESVLTRQYLGEGGRTPFDQACPRQLGIGPDSINHRFITEDVPVSCQMFRQLARALGTETPVMDALVSLAALMVDDPARLAPIVTLENTGLGGLHGGALLQFLREGMA